MKLLIYGGTFDPPHIGHIGLFNAALQKTGPDRALIIPARTPPHKTRKVSAARHRVRMCRCFLIDERVRISRIELLSRGKNYSVKTVERLKKRFANADIYMLVGSDMLIGFREWYEYKRLLKMCTIVAGLRDDEDEERFEAMRSELENEGAKIVELDFRITEISSTEIRAGRADEYLTKEVREYIERKGLYKTADGDGE